MRFGKLLFFSKNYQNLILKTLKILETWDFSVRLVEWLEMVKLLGGEKVYFYILGAQSSVMKVLNYYTREVGFWV